MISKMKNKTKDFEIKMEISAQKIKFLSDRVRLLEKKIKKSREKEWKLIDEELDILSNYINLLDKNNEGDEEKKIMVSEEPANETNKVGNLSIYYPNFRNMDRYKIFTLFINERTTRRLSHHVKLQDFISRFKHFIAPLLISIKKEDIEAFIAQAGFTIQKNGSAFSIMNIEFKDPDIRDYLVVDKEMF